MTGRRGNAGAVATTVAIVVGALLVIMLAAQVGPHSLIHGHLRGPDTGGVDSGNRGGSLFHGLGPPASAGGVPAHEAFFRGVGRVVQLALIVCGIAGLATLIVVLVRRALAAYSPERPPETEVDFDVLDAPELVADALVGDAADQLALLLGGSPRNAIVACWDRFEEQGERVGVGRRSWETSSEYTIRLLDLVHADAAAVSRLERLYHEARFSEHDIDESRRDSAVEALESIHRSLGVKVPG